jgi:cytochrome c oxidase assembly factor CtaG
MWLPTLLLILLGVIALVFWSAAEDLENDY